MEDKSQVCVFILENDPAYAKTIQPGLEENGSYTITHFTNGEDF